MTKLIPVDYQTFLTNNIFFPFMKYLAVKSVRITSTSLSQFPKICPDSGTGCSQRIRQILSGLTLGVGQKIANLVRIESDLTSLPLPRVLVRAGSITTSRSVVAARESLRGVFRGSLEAYSPGACSQVSGRSDILLSTRHNQTRTMKTPCKKHVTDVYCIFYRATQIQPDQDRVSGRWSEKWALC